MKAATKDELRKKISEIDGIYSCWIERAKKERKTGKYDIVIRISAGEISLAALDGIGRLFKTGSVNVETGYEITGCCELCSGPQTYLEIDVGGATLPN